MNLFTLKRAVSIRLGQEIGRGGEGAVFTIEGQNDRVAKVYSTQPDRRKIQKLAAMAEAASPALLRIAAWPTDLLIDRHRAVRGFVMPRIFARRDVHELYSPRSRSEAFPQADFRFLVHVGANIARAFAVIHEHGHVLGDVNHGNLLVGSDGTVVLIDCDSFQISSRGSDVFTCDVGVPLFTAPELHGRSFRNLQRTPNHDLFGLSVLLFHLLYLGRHPFAGRYSGPGDMPIEKAIAEYRFAYGPDRARNGMDRPPGTIPLETMGMTIAQQFTRAFNRSGSSGGRPDAKSWVAALSKLQASLRRCSVASRHYYPNELGACPWCAVEAQTSVRLFDNTSPLNNRSVQRLAPAKQTNYSAAHASGLGVHVINNQLIIATRASNRIQPTMPIAQVKHKFLPWLVVIIVVVIILAAVGLDQSPKPISATRIGDYTKCGQMGTPTASVDAPCQRLRTKLESESIEVDESLTTNAHCHLRVSGAAEVNQARLALCVSSPGTLMRVQKEGLNSFSIFFLAPDGVTRFDGYISPEGRCIETHEMIEWQQYQCRKPENISKSSL